jgi:hypothetical protein
LVDRHGHGNGVRMMKSTDKNDPRETPKDDPREKQDWGKQSQSNEPWKQNAQNTTDPSLPDTPKPDLEKWEKSNTH